MPKADPICRQCKDRPSKYGNFCGACMYQKRKQYFSDRVQAGYYEGKRLSQRARIKELYYSRHPVNCHECGWDKHPEILHIHHKDGDKNNSEDNNLISLCPNCHYSKHFEEKTSSWSLDRLKKYDTSNYRSTWRKSTANPQQGHFAKQIPVAETE